MSNTYPSSSSAAAGDNDEELRPHEPRSAVTVAEQLTERANRQHNEALDFLGPAGSQASQQRDEVAALSEQPQDTATDATVEDEWFDGDSAIGSSSQTYVSSTTSLRPSIFENVQQFGRTYHSYKDGKYVLPNDEKEQDRLDFQHVMLCELAGGGLTVAPIDTIPLHNVLDIATGTGVWAIDFADAHPSANVIGTDLSPIQPIHVPPNCSFVVDDAEDEWLWKDPFSYIHGRAIITCFRDPLHVIRSSYDCLSPGGILEFQDPTFPLKFADPQPPPDSPYVKWQDLMHEAAEKAGRPWTNPPKYKRWFESVGFVDVHEKRFFFPTGPWCTEHHQRRIGAWQLQNWVEAIEAMTPRMLSRLGWEAEESMVLVAQVREELLKGGLKLWCDYLSVWGRKPELGQQDAAAGAADA